MRKLLAVLFVFGLAAWADSRTAIAGDPPNNSYSLYSTGNYANSPKNSPLRKMTTAQLQQRRLDLYRTIPYGQTRRGVPYYTYSGQPLPQQDELLALEAELNRRYQAGDKSAELKRPIPGAQHPH
jgi:hypothetical protein